MRLSVLSAAIGNTVGLAFSSLIKSLLTLDVATAKNRPLSNGFTLSKDMLNSLRKRPMFCRSLDHVCSPVVVCV